MYSIIFTYGGEHDFFDINNKKEADLKFNELKKRVDEYTKKNKYSAVTMSSTSIYGEEEMVYDNFDAIR